MAPCAGKVAAPTTARAKQIKLGPPPGDADRLLLNQTITQKGFEFYQAFTNQWSDPQRGNYLVIVKEMPARGRAIQLTVELNGNEVMDRTLIPNHQALTELARAAAEYVIGSIDRQGGGQLQQTAQPELRAYGY